MNTKGGDDDMEVKVTKSQVKKLLEKHGEVELDLYEKGKNPNNLMTAILSTKIVDIKDFDEKLLKLFKEFSERKAFDMAIWKDDDE